MGSIYSLVKKGRVKFIGSLEGPTGAGDLVHQATCHPDPSEGTPPCVLVDIQSSIDELFAGRVATKDLYRLPPVTPPYQNMWFEGRLGTVPFAIQVRRVLINKVPQVVELWQWMENAGNALFPLMGCELLLREDGTVGGYLHRDLRSEWGKAQGMDSGKDVMNTKAGIACHVLAKLNCANVKLSSPPEKRCFKGTRRQKPKEALASVWRTIRVKETERPAKVHGSAAKPDCIETRLRWIKGHYGDYRHGAGLFGKETNRRVYYFPEHSVGNPDLGEQITEYEV